MGLEKEWTGRAVRLKENLTLPLDSERHDNQENKKWLLTRAVGESQVSVRIRGCLKPLVKRYFSQNTPYVFSASHLPYTSLNTAHPVTFPPYFFLCSLYFIRLPISCYQFAFYYPIPRHIASHSLNGDGNPKARPDPGEVLWAKARKLMLEAWTVGWFG